MPKEKIQWVLLEKVVLKGELVEGTVVRVRASAQLAQESFEKVKDALEFPCMIFPTPQDVVVGTRVQLVHEEAE